MTRRPLARAAIATIAALALVACSSGDERSTSTASAPATIDTTAPAVTTPATSPATDGVATTDSAPAADTTATVSPPGTVESVPTSDTMVDTTDATDTTADTVPETAPPATGEPLTIDELLALGRPVVLAHAGGEDVHPHSTPFAYAESVAAGVDMLDFDVRLTADGVLVVHHDEDVDRTTNGTGPVASMTYDELHALDNAHWYTDRCVCKDAPSSEYVYRGMRTGEVDPPLGYGPDDFAVPRLRDIIALFPSMPLNIEIKTTGEAGVETARVLAVELAELDRLDHAVVTSFDDTVNDAFRGFAPDVEITPGLGAASGWVLERVPLPHGMRILQLPPEFQGFEVLTPEVIADSTAAGYPIWVWPNDRSLEDFGGYQRFLLAGLAGLNANDPSAAVAAVEAHGAGEGGPASAPLAAAASAAQTALTEGDGLGDCPYGPTDGLIAALPGSLPLADGFFGPDGVEDDGQIFIGGDVNIVYCVLRPDDGGEGPLDEIRLDVAPGPDVDIAQYLAEEFTDDDVDVGTGGAFLHGGRFRTGCWDDDAFCGAFWQGDGLFIAAVLSGEEAQQEKHAATAVRVLVPLVVERLAARAT